MFKGNLEFTLYQLGGVAIGAGFGEEFLFRGFLFQRVAMMFGGSKLAWSIACVIQAAAFGLLHAYQGPLGIVLTASIGLINGLVFLAAGRNLWVTISRTPFTMQPASQAFSCMVRRRGEFRRSESRARMIPTLCDA